MAGDVDRRTILGAAVALGVPASRAAAASTRLFRSGPLAANPVARRFDATPGLAVPSTALLGDSRIERFSDLVGKVRIVTLWAEWCVPCVAEMADLAALHGRYGGRDFEIVAVLTASQRKLDYAGAKAFLGPRRGTMPLLVEPRGGMTLLTSLAAQSLPCNLIVDRHGQIRGRALGAAMLEKSSAPMTSHVLTGAEKARLLAGSEKTTWASPAAAVFVKALIGNALA